MTDKKNNIELDILQAAEELFFKRGYAATTTADIARRAGVRQPHIYYYYRSKEKILEAVLARGLAPVRRYAELVESIEDDMPFLDFFERIMRYNFAMFKENAEFMRFANRDALMEIHAAQAFPQEIKQIVGKVHTCVERRMKPAVEAGEIRYIPVHSLLGASSTLIMGPILTKPLMKHFMQDSATDYDTFINERFEVDLSMLKSMLRP